MNPQEALLLVLGWLERATTRKDQLKRERDLLLAAAKRCVAISPSPRYCRSSCEIFEDLSEAIRKVEQNATGQTPQ